MQSLALNRFLSVVAKFLDKAYQLLAVNKSSDAETVKDANEILSLQISAINPLIDKHLPVCRDINISNVKAHYWPPAPL